MTIDTKNLRVLAEDCMNREIDFDDVSPNQGSTSCDKLTRAYFRDANPAAILALLDALERKDSAIKKCYGEVIRGLADVVNVHTPDKLFDLDAIPRDPVMAIVSRIKTSMEAITKEQK